MVRFKGARETSVMAFVKNLGVSQEDTMEGPLWRDTLGRSLGSHDVVVLVGGMRRSNGCGHIKIYHLPLHYILHKDRTELSPTNECSTTH